MATYPATHAHDALDADETAQPPPYDDHADVEPEEHTHLATLEEKKRRWWRNAFINAAFIASWCVVRSSRHYSLVAISWHLTASVCSSRYIFATILSVYNKWMFSHDRFGFPFPLFVTMMHMYVQFLLAAALRVFWPRKFRPEYSPSRRDYA